VTSKPDFKVMVLLLVFMQLTRDLFAIAKFLSYNYIRVPQLHEQVAGQYSVYKSGISQHAIQFL